MSQELYVWHVFEPSLLKSHKQDRKSVVQVAMHLKLCSWNISFLFCISPDFYTFPPTEEISRSDTQLTIYTPCKCMSIVNLSLHISVKIFSMRYIKDILCSFCIDFFKFLKEYLFGFFGMLLKYNSNYSYPG